MVILNSTGLTKGAKVKLKFYAFLQVATSSKL